MTLAYQIKEKKRKKTQQLQTKDGPINKRSFKNIKITLGRTYLQWLFLNSQSVLLSTGGCSLQRIRSKDEV